MQRIAKAVISLFELLEAEGRSLRESVVSVIEGMVIAFFAAALVFVGIAVAFLSLCLWLSKYIGMDGATAVVAVLFLASGCSIFAVSRTKIKRKEGAAVVEEEKREIAEEVQNKTDIAQPRQRVRASRVKAEERRQRRRNCRAEARAADED